MTDVFSQNRTQPLSTASVYCAHQTFSRRSFVCTAFLHFPPTLLNLCNMQFWHQHSQRLCRQKCLREPSPVNWPNVMEHEWQTGYAVFNCNISNINVNHTLTFSLIKSPKESFFPSPQTLWIPSILAIAIVSMETNWLFKTCTFPTCRCVQWSKSHRASLRY